MSAGETVDARLHAVTRAYEMIAEPLHRAHYDRTIGHRLEPVLTRPIRAPRRSLFSRLRGRRVPAPNVDYYEILGLGPEAPTSQAREAYHVMRDVYLRAPNPRKRMLLIRLLNDALAIVGDPEQRAHYDEKRKGRAERVRITNNDGITSVAEPPPPLTEPAPTLQVLIAQASPSATMSTNEAEPHPPPQSPPFARALPTRTSGVAVEPEPKPAPVAAGDEQPAPQPGEAEDIPPRAAPGVAGAEPVTVRLSRQLLLSIVRVAATVASAIGRSAAACARGLGALVRAIISRLSQWRQARSLAAATRDESPVGASPAAASAPQSPRRPRDLEEAFLGRLASTVEHAEKSHSVQPEPEA